MKGHFLASVAVGALMAATPAFAAPPQPPAIFSWTGFYAGGNAGYSWGTARSDFTDTGFAEGFGIGFGGQLPASYPTSLKPDGGIGGVQFGYNRQFAPNWVVGIEADFQASAEADYKQLGNAYTCDTEGPTTCNLTQTRDAKIRWFDTLRGRLGWLITPTAWVYGTAGVAFGKVSVQGSVTDSFINTGASFVFGDSQIKTGYAVGAGIEGVLPNSTDFTWKVEYLYIDLGSLGGGGIEPISGSAYNWNTKFIDNIIRVGINYKIR
jgi:outer membrane immunogenic protein